MTKRDRDELESYVIVMIKDDELGVGRRVNKKEIEWLVFDGTQLKVDARYGNEAYVADSVLSAFAAPFSGLKYCHVSPAIYHRRCKHDPMFFLTLLKPWMAEYTYNNMKRDVTKKHFTEHKAIMIDDDDEGEETKEDEICDLLDQLPEKEAMQREAELRRLLNTYDFFSGKMATKFWHLFEVEKKEKHDQRREFTKRLRQRQRDACEKVELLKQQKKRALSASLEEFLEGEKTRAEEAPDVLCSICLQEEEDEEDETNRSTKELLISCSTQAHFAHVNCAVKWMGQKEPKKASTKCLGLQCDGFYDVMSCKNIPHAWKQALEKDLFLIDNKADLFECAHCHAETVMLLTDYQEETQCCSRCGKETCTDCRAQAHIGRGCQSKPLNLIPEVRQRDVLECGHCHAMGVIDKNACLKSRCPACNRFSCAYCSVALVHDKEMQMYQHFCRALATDKPGKACKHVNGQPHCPLWPDKEACAQADVNFAQEHRHLIVHD